VQVDLVGSDTRTLLPAGAQTARVPLRAPAGPVRAPGRRHPRQPNRITSA
jgi:hypothetical protein